MSALTSLANIKSWLPNQVDLPIEAITQANPGVVTCPNHGLQTGARIIPYGIAGMTDLNGVTLTTTRIDQDTFSIAVNTSAYPAYAGGGMFGADDALLTRLLNAASEAFERETQRTFAEASHTWRTDGNGQRHLFLTNYPVSAIASVAIDGVSIPESIEEVLTGLCTDGWYLEDDCLSLLGYRFNCGRRNVVIAYTAGYSEIPEDIQQAVVSLVAYQYQGRQHIGLRSQSINDVSTTSYAIGDMPDDVKSTIERYRRVPSC